MFKATTTTMDDVIVIESEDSDNSIVEVEVPKKPTPPLIQIEDEELILNIAEKRQESILAQDFINNDLQLSTMSIETHNPQVLSSPDHWTPDMIKFYNEDWGNEEHFIVEKIQEKMDKQPSLWKTSKKDELFQYGNRRNNMKCWNCGQRGHPYTNCPDPPHVPKCHMCGTKGHSNYSCPNSKCLNCGTSSRDYVTCCYKCRKQLNEVCSRCHLIGHNFINCPDHWRLFHLTIGTTSVRIPEKDVNKLDKDMWCCNCGRQGHFQTHCMKTRDCNAFRDSLPFVVSYQKAFNDNVSSKNSGKVRKKHKKNREMYKKDEKVLRINPMHKVIKKSRIELNNKGNKFKKIKKKKKKKKGAGGFFDCFPV